jgi:mycothiol synthase
MTLDIRPFDPSAASETELDDYFAMRTAVAAVDMPEDVPMTREAYVGRLLSPEPHLGDCLFWAAYEGGRLIGLVWLGLPQDENDGMIITDLWVHPDHRRRSVGTGLLKAALPAMAESGRTNLVGILKDETPGARFTASLGCHIVRRTVVQRLDVPSVPPSTWDVPPSPGYRLTQWVGATPDDLLAAYAAARLAIQDAPASEASYRQPDWTPERIRHSEQQLAEQGTEERVVVAVEEATGRIVGVTSMLFYPHRPDYGYQNDTSVVGEHRGHGLGVAMKAAMMRWIRAERPQVAIILTTTAKANEHMIDVNLRVGYKTLRSIIYVETTVARLTEQLSSAVQTV